MAGNYIDNWEQKLRVVFDEIDDEIEERFGKLYSLHPARPRRGTTSSREQDGLFNIGASFSPGFGSDFGRGYVLDVDMITLEHVTEEVRSLIEENVVVLLREKLRVHFPLTKLEVRQERNCFKICGDLSFKKGAN
jgi:hypothetical protein